MVLWILNTGAQWHMLPQGYANYKTVHRRFQQWCREETLRKVLTDLANTLREEGETDESEDGRRLRRYERRWIMERFFTWMQWRRRLVVRWEYYPMNFLGFVQLAAICILLRHF